MNIACSGPGPLQEQGRFEEEIRIISVQLSSRTKTIPMPVSDLSGTDGDYPELRFQIIKENLCVASFV